MQPAGLALTGFWSAHFGAGTLAGDVLGSAAQFPTILASTPSGLIFTSLASTNIAGGPIASNITMWGADVRVTAAANGAGYWIGTYQTLGN